MKIRLHNLTSFDLHADVTVWDEIVSQGVVETVCEVMIVHEWKFCLICASLNAERICPNCLGCDNCCKCASGSLPHRLSNEGAFLRRKARRQHEAQEERTRAGKAPAADAKSTPHDTQPDDHREGGGPDTP